MDAARKEEGGKGTIMIFRTIPSISVITTSFQLSLIDWTALTPNVSGPLMPRHIGSLPLILTLIGLGLHVLEVVRGGLIYKIVEPVGVQ